MLLRNNNNTILFFILLLLYVITPPPPNVLRWHLLLLFRIHLFITYYHAYKPMPARGDLELAYTETEASPTNDGW